MGDLETDFGFAGMFWLEEAGLNLTRFRSYDPNLGRWLSRDPLKDAEVEEGYNLYCYVHNNPVNFTDPLGLHSCCGQALKDSIKRHLEVTLIGIYADVIMALIAGYALLLFLIAEGSAGLAIALAFVGGVDFSIGAPNIAKIPNTWWNAVN
jgi:RHS repeat-associated protein